MQARMVEFAKWTVLKILAFIDLIRRVVRPVRGRILRSECGEVESGKSKTLCVFAHFDRGGVVDDYVVNYLRALYELGCETVVVSTAESLDDRNIQKALPYCSRFIVKQNTGYDFASWRTALEAVGDLSGYDRLIVANDSVYGPLQDLGPIFDEMERRDVDFWGITDSLKYGRHLQSYFMVFKKHVLQSPTFSDFWRRLPDYKHKYVVIIQGEIGLSRRLDAAGFKFMACCPVEAVQAELKEKDRGLVERFGDPRTSPTHRGWRALMRIRCPFLKVQLLRDNPMQVPDVADWEAVLRETSDYDIGFIDNHLKRMQMNLGGRRS